MWALRDADREIPNRWEISFARALIYFQTKMWSRALAQFVESLNTNPGRFTYYPVKKDVAFVWFTMAMCFEQLKDYHSAKKCYTFALQFEKEKPEKEQNQEQVKILEFILKVA
jgi:tetratricopeptide (TPR) repeat protein